MTTLYGITVPQGNKQVCRYDDGTGDELEVPLGTTAFVSGKTMFDILPEAYKNLAVRSKVKYSPHPYVWMAPAHAMPTGLGIESEGLELPTEELPEWEESKLKIFPMVCCRLIFIILSKRDIYILFFVDDKVWKNPVTGGLHFEVHPCGAKEILVDPLPKGAKREGALYPDGAVISDLKEVRGLLYKMQRPAISPSVSFSDLNLYLCIYFKKTSHTACLPA